MASILTRVVIFLSCLQCAISTLNFTRQPQNVMVDKGGRVRLRCRFIGLSNDYVIIWTKNDKNISVNSEIVGDRFTVDRERYHIIGGFKKDYFDLRIRDVNRLDTGVYSCRVHERLNGSYSSPTWKNTTRILGRTVLQSKTSQVKVYYLPSYQYPHCPSTTHKRDVAVGEVVPVCFSDNGYPDITVALHDSQDPMNMLHRDPNRVKIEKGSSGFLFVTLNISQTEHGRSYWCVTSSPEFPYYAHKCSVGPFNVVFKPQVTIRPLRYALHEGENAVFVCEADANPSPISVEWSIYPPIDDELVHYFDHNRTMQILDLKAEYDGRLLSCTVTNSRGSQTGKRILAVNHDHSQIPKITVIPPDEGTPPDGSQEPFARCYLVFDILGPLLVGAIILLVLLIVLVLMKHSKNERFVRRRPARMGPCLHKRISDMELSTSTASTVDEMSTMVQHKDNGIMERTNTMQTIVDN